jgi:hypothetical protein
VRLEPVTVGPLFVRQVKQIVLKKKADSLRVDGRVASRSIQNSRADTSPPESPKDRPGLPTKPSSRSGDIKILMASGSQKNVTLPALSPAELIGSEYAVGHFVSGSFQSGHGPANHVGSIM